MSDPTQWKWCGHPHLFDASDSCRFHLTTYVGRFMVSTVGDYHPDGLDQPYRPLGGDDTSFFETMVFSCDPDDLNDGCPTVTDWTEKWWNRYVTAPEANDGHMAACIEWSTR